MLMELGVGFPSFKAVTRMLKGRVLDSMIVVQMEVDVMNNMAVIIQQDMFSSSAFVSCADLPSLISP